MITREMGLVPLTVKSLADWFGIFFSWVNARMWAQQASAVGYFLP